MILTLAPATFAKSARERVVGVENFGRVTEHYFRGGEFTPDGAANLARMGVRTVIDLRDDPSADEPEVCRRVGLTYVSLPMTGHDSLVDHVVAQVFSVIQNAKQPVYVHCTAGKHRAGTVAALYRIRVQGWPKERAWAEQQSYGFGMPGEHPELYAYVYGPPAKPAGRSGLSASARYVSLASAVRSARAGGGRGEVLKIDLEWDEDRSVATWDVTFSSNLEYEVEAVSGKLLDTKPKSAAMLAVFSPLALDGVEPGGLLSFQEIMRKAEESHGQTVTQMELKHLKGQAGAVYQVDTADDATLYYDAATGSVIEGPSTNGTGN